MSDQQAIEDAKRLGYYCRSGNTLAELLEWKAWCRANGRPCIVVAKLTRKAFVEVDGRQVWEGSVEGADIAAAGYVAPCEIEETLGLFGPL